MTTPQTQPPADMGEMVERCQRALNDAVIDFANEPVTIDSDDLRALLSSRDELARRGRALVGKLDACAPHIDGLFAFAEMHGSRPYAGPTFGVELKAFRAALKDIGGAG